MFIVKRCGSKIFGCKTMTCLAVGSIQYTGIAVKLKHVKHVRDLPGIFLLSILSSCVYTLVFVGAYSILKILQTQLLILFLYGILHARVMLALNCLPVCVCWCIHRPENNLYKKRINVN